LSDRGGYSGLPHIEGLAAQDAMVLAVVRWRLPLKLAVAGKEALCRAGGSQALHLLGG
jgi:hypothetical protein